MHLTFLCEIKLCCHIKKSEALRKSQLLIDYKELSQSKAVGDSKLDWLPHDCSLNMCVYFLQDTTKAVFPNFVEFLEHLLFKLNESSQILKKNSAFNLKFDLGRTPQSCGLICHAFDRKVEGSNLVAAKIFFYSNGQKNLFSEHRAEEKGVFGYNLNVMKNHLYKMSEHVLDIYQ